MSNKILSGVGAVAAALILLPAAASAQGNGVPAATGTTGTTTTEKFELVPKGSGEKTSNFENNTIGSVSTLDYSDPDKGFYGLALPQQKLYTGIIPRVRDTLPHIGGYQRSALKANKPNRLTWIGYQRMADKSRVFIQTGTSPEYTLGQGQRSNELVVVLKNTRPSFYNFYRSMDTRWMNRAISDIRSYRSGRDVRVVISLKTKVEFSTSNDGAYIYVDFSDGHLEPKTEVQTEERQPTVYDDPGADR